MEGNQFPAICSRHGLLSTVNSKSADKTSTRKEKNRYFQNILEKEKKGVIVNVDGVSRCNAVDVDMWQGLGGITNVGS